jgi:hypothetical protein
LAGYVANIDKVPLKEILTEFDIEDTEKASK